MFLAVTDFLKEQIHACYLSHEHSLCTENVSKMVPNAFFFIQMEEFIGVLLLLHFGKAPVLCVRQKVSVLFVQVPHRAQFCFGLTRKTDQRHHSRKHKARR